jgi:hypothetical protein
LSIVVDNKPKYLGATSFSVQNYGKGGRINIIPWEGIAMKKTKEELKGEAVEGFERDIREMLDNYDEILEPEDPGNPRIDRIEAIWSDVRVKSDPHIAKLMNQLAEGVLEKELIIKKRTSKSGGGK